MDKDEIDLVCKEHVSDSETDSQNDEDVPIENKVWRHAWWTDYILY